MVICFLQIFPLPAEIGTVPIYVEEILKRRAELKKLTLERKKLYNLGSIGKGKRDV